MKMVRTKKNDASIETQPNLHPIVDLKIHTTTDTHSHSHTHTIMY